MNTKLMTDAMTDAAKMSTNVTAEMMAMGKDHQREKMAIGERNTSRKARMVPARKKANMISEQILRMLRISVRAAGRAMVAPDKSSSKMTWTMLNQ